MNERSLIFALMRVRDENKMQLIRQKAMELIARQGLDNFSIHKLAKAAGVSPATIYIYYEDREDLIVQLCTDMTTELLTTSMIDFDPDMHFAEGMRIQWRNRAAYFMKNPVIVEFIEHIRYTPLYKKISVTLNQRFGETMGRFVHNAIKRKELVKLPFEVYWSMAFAPMHQLLKFHSQGKSYKNEHFAVTDKMLMQTCELVIKALTP